MIRQAKKKKDDRILTESNFLKSENRRPDNPRAIIMDGKSSLARSSWSLHRFGFFLTPHLPRYLLIEILVYQEYFIIAALSSYHKNCRCFCVFQISHNAVVTAPNCQYHLMQIERIWRDCKTKIKSWILPVIIFCFEFDLLHLKKKKWFDKPQSTQ